ncbi:hypothetical protein Pryu01_01225 [Paraliobacillus ryukyuensis]|uniref:Phage-related minor tail protein n=1 Tax=Paraliobacillus ryukyuensis TaxID=200904 RepID=A0A366EAZ6_9BACI|nr:phage tail tape measure protein [Paraliobacillus ryukyuensis]RBO99541.1 phage-related minor tail protein [Paraliobacillus ryukyuensis]
MPERIEGLSIELDLDSMKVNSGLKDLKSQLTVVNSEMKANMSAFDRSDKSIEKYETRLRGLNRKLEVQQSVTDSARKTYEKMVKEYGEGSKEAQKAAKEYNNQVASLNNLSRYVGRVENDLAKLKEEQRISNSNWTKMGNHLDKVGNKVKTFGDKTSIVGNTMSTTVTPAILGLGAAAGVVAGSYEDSAVRIQNTLGLTAEETKELTNISRNIYNNGFGESADQIDQALLQVKQNIRNVNNEDLERITEKAFLLADTFESDVNEVTRAGNNVMKGFGIEADEAFDLMARGAQKGLNFSNEMFDNLSEYSTLFASMGYSAEEYFELLQKGTDAGVYNLDYINDVMKEFQIRIKDGSATTSDAIGKLSDATQEVWEQYEDGEKTVKDVSNAVLKELEGMDDQVEANQVGVDLYGTKWEDLESTAMYSMGEIGEGIEGVDGTMEDMTKNAEQSISKQWASTWREAKEVLLPVGETLLDFTRDVLPDVKDGIEDVTDWFEELDEEGKKNIVMLGGIAAAAGPVLSVVGGLSSGIGGLMKVTGGLFKGLGKVGGKGLLGRIGAMALGTGPVGLAVAGVGALGVGLYTLTKRNNETEEATLEVAKSLNDQALELENSAETFDRLSEKAKISNEELARLNDLNIRISESSNPGEIEQLQKQYNNLAKESGLSKDELNELFEANKKIIDQTPDVKTNVSKQGNAFAKNTEEVNEYISSMYEATRIELEGERLKNLEKEKETRKEINKLNKEHEQYQDRITQLVKAKEMSEEARGERIREIANIIDTETLSTEEQIKLTNEKNDLIDIQNGKYSEIYDTLTNSTKETREKIANEKESLEKIKAFDAEYQNIILKQIGINEEGQKGLEQLDQSIAKNNEEIAKLEEKRQKNGQLNEEEQDRLNKLIESNNEREKTKLYIFEELGLYNNINSLLDNKLSKLSQEEQQRIDNLAKTSEIKVEEGNIIGQIQTKNGELAKTREELIKNLEKEGATTSEINNQVGELDSKLIRNDQVLEDVLREAGLWDQVKDQINMGSDAIAGQGYGIDDNNNKVKNVQQNGLLLNDILSQDVNKNVDVDDNGTADKLNDEVTKRENKNVDVSLARRNNIWDLIPSSVNVGVNLIGGALGFAKGTDSHPGGVSWLGEEGPELVKHNNNWAMAGFGLYDVPKGTQVFTHKETTNMISSIPGYASGISPTGEADKIVQTLKNNPFNKLLALLGKQTTSPSQSTRSTSVVDYTKELLNATLEQNKILVQLLSKDTNMYLDSNVLGESLEPVVTEIQTRNERVRNEFA